jgi:rare lipoprotein A
MFSKVFLKKWALVLALCCVCFWNEVSAQDQSFGFSQKGFATYYGDYFHGRRTASGEKYDKEALTAAHRTLPFGSILKVTNLSNGKFAVVKINDRGPFGGANRIIDLSMSAAREIDMIRAGVTQVQIQVIDTGGVLINGYPKPAPAPIAANAPVLTPALASIRPRPDYQCLYPAGGTYTLDGTRVLFESWGLQTGAFSNPQSAHELARQMRASGMDCVYIMAEEDRFNARMLYKVIIGLYSTAKEAQEDIPAFLQKGLPSNVFPVQYVNT